MPSLLGADSDWHSVLIAAADEDGVLLFQSEIAGVDVGRNVNACEMPDMHAAVGIGKSGGDGRAFEILCHKII